MRASLTQRESAGTQTLRLRSCHSLWIFDVEHRRFRRLPGDVSPDDLAGGRDWQAYVALEVDPGSGSFRVFLNQERTQMLRSWLHDDPCRHCGGLVDDAPTGEIVLHP
jgi:hypothetical protein